MLPVTARRFCFFSAAFWAMLANVCTAQTSVMLDTSVQPSMAHANENVRITVRDLPANADNGAACDVFLEASQQKAISVTTQGHISEDKTTGAKFINFVVPSSIVVANPAVYRVRIAGVDREGRKFTSLNHAYLTAVPPQRQKQILTSLVEQLTRRQKGNESSSGSDSRFTSSNLVVVNAASYQQGPISPGELIRIYSEGLRSRSADTRVHIGDEQIAVLSHPDDGILVQAPESVRGKSTVVVRLTSGGRTVETNLSVSPESPALFASDSFGRGPAQLETDLGEPILETERGIRPNSRIVLLATGLGSAEQKPAVHVGGIPAEVLRITEHPAIRGVFRLLINIPSGIKGSIVPVSLKVGENFSQDGVTMAVQSSTVNTATGNLAPDWVSLDPFSGVAATQVFTAVFSDGNGYTDITTAYLLVNGGLTPGNGCYLEYNRSANTFRLLDDAGSSWMGPAAAGSAVTLQNTQCSLAVASSSATGSGNQLRVNFAITFKAAFAGRKGMWVNAYDTASATTNWFLLGNWYVNSAGGVLTSRYRLFDPYSHSHFFTTDLNEYLVLGARGFSMEGAASNIYDAPAVLSGVATTPFYRIYDSLSLQHLWTTDRNEYLTLIGWRSIYLGEGADGLVFNVSVPSTVPLYRLVYCCASPPIHHWTEDLNEYNVLGNSGWSKEGIAAYVIPASTATPPVLTVSPAEGATVSGTAPSIVVSYSDGGSGVDTSTLVITLDGANVTSQFTLGSASAAGQPALPLGQHTIRATVRNRAGAQGVASSTFTVGAFVSLPSATPATGPVPLTVTFKSDGAYAAGSITRWRWDFTSDGVYDTDAVGPLDYSRTFFTVGVYKAKLELTNDKGEVTSNVVTVTVTNPPPTASASVNPSNGGAPMTVSFSGSGTSGNGSIVKYEWDFQGDGVFDYTSTFSGSTSFTYSQPGTYNAVFRVTDNVGQTAIAPASATQVRVGAAAAPTATITTPSTAVAGTGPYVRTFNGTGTAGAGRTITKYEWDFNGDGVYDYSSATTASTSFTYNSPGTFTAALRVTDNTGATGIDTVDVTVTITATLTLTTDTVRIAQAGIVGVTTKLDGAAPVTLFIKNKAGQVVRTLVDNVSRAAGTYTDNWDGKDGAGLAVADGLYYAVLQYKAGSNTVTLDLTDSANTTPTSPTWTTRLSSSGTVCGYSPPYCTINPLTDDFLEADFTLTKALELSLDIRQIDSGLEVARIFDRVPFGRAIPYSVFWDGTDVSGKPLQTVSGDGYLLGLIGYALPANGIYVENRPIVSNVSATPNYFSPSIGDLLTANNPTVKVGYSVNKASTLVLKVFRSGNNAVLRTITQSVTATTGAIEWDGRTDNGLFADSGDYHLALKAIDAAGNQSVVRYVLVRLYH